METPTADDLLQFRDYSGGAPAQINVNSPTHSSGGGSGGSAGGGGSNNANAQRQRGDPLADLIYDMTTSAQGLSGDGGQQAQNSSLDGSAGGAGGAAGGARLSFLTIEYYQQFFNVDTYMVLERIANSMIPKRAAGNYLRMNIGENPDLYGPFWITITLIFSIAISGNIASYLHHATDSYRWHYNFHLVSYAATCIFLYANILPAVLWALFKYSLKPVDSADAIETDSATYTPSLLSLMCIYGYSLAIYIPVSILWVINISLLQWILVITAALLSGTVLIAVLTPALRNSQFSLFLIIGILSAHVVLAAGFMLYFFHNPSDSLAAAAAAPAPAAPAAPAALKAVTQAVLNAVPVNQTH
ncbi:protein YIPF1 isoform X2 [Drosophila subpulchrella]|uniref:protein YIPF1 isoform X2 n=1 Tax=Drosophila subpulchrella TaxID=1486046 RepID=UPI0018A1B0D1|nr:protein YIPF1 isoform X2 [Drosophila subpulchrella]